MIPGDFLSTCPPRQFRTLPSLLDSQAALSNSYTDTCLPMQGSSLYHFNDGLWYDPVGARTHDLPILLSPHFFEEKKGINYVLQFVVRPSFRPSGYPSIRPSVGLSVRPSASSLPASPPTLLMLESPNLYA